MESQVHLKMIQFEEAQAIIRKIVIESRKNESVPLDLALNRILAKDYKSLSGSPPYNSSAMDGIVVNKNDLKNAIKTILENEKKFKNMDNEFMKKFSYENFADKMTSIYSELLKK